MDLRVELQPTGAIASFGDRKVRCAVGRSGLTTEKHEGDGATPVGAWPIREILYRADRVPSFATGLPHRALSPEDGWCDAPGDPAYNRFVTLPYPGRHERLWRDDHVYDVIAVLGYNDDPIVDGAGSAIFLHLARANYGPTEGCVALAQGDLLAFLALATPGSRIVVQAEST